MKKQVKRFLRKGEQTTSGVTEGSSEQHVVKPSVSASDQNSVQGKSTMEDQSNVTQTSQVRWPNLLQ